MEYESSPGASCFLTMHKSCTDFATESDHIGIQGRDGLKDTFFGKQKLASSLTPEYIQVDSHSWPWKARHERLSDCIVMTIDYSLASF